LGAGDVTNIDKQRLAAVQKLEQLGYTFAGEWMHPANDASVAVLVPAVIEKSARLGEAKDGGSSGTKAYS